MPGCPLVAVSVAHALQMPGGCAVSLSRLPCCQLVAVLMVSPCRGVGCPCSPDAGRVRGQLVAVSVASHGVPPVAVLSVSARRGVGCASCRGCRVVSLSRCRFPCRLPGSRRVGGGCQGVSLSRSSAGRDTKVKTLGIYLSPLPLAVKDAKRTAVWRRNFFRLCLMFFSFKVAQKRLPKPTFRLGNLCIKGAFSASYMYLFISILRLAQGKALSGHLPTIVKNKQL